MLIPAIDLLGGKIVQLVQGKRKALEFDNFDYWIERFAKYPLVQLIDLDAAMGQGNNRSLVERFAQSLPCQVGGGIRTTESAQAMLGLGAKKVIIGSSLIRNGEIATVFASELASVLGREKLVFAVDSRSGTVATDGWRTRTAISPLMMVKALDLWCGAFLYTNIETEGLMQGLPLEAIRQLRAATARRLIAAGGIASNDEIALLDAMKVDAVAGMAVYTSRLNV